jgi:DNA-binding response OmpR family regulator
VRAARDGQAGLAEAQRQPPSLIILDLLLPGLSGWEVCRMLKVIQKQKAFLC